ncbi:NPC intracellular cholesterol transporter 2 [Polyergus mexicanus]|uniref:NPC intracellular cholesterol transporter 2 n=1 Tax=Polyergus mexicanus TaxID=615972 RepID=UPI0038B4D411
MKAFVFACIVAAFCVAASLQSTPHYPCDDGPLPLELRIEGCDGSPCIIYKGTNLTAQWDFVANADAKSLVPRVMVSIMGATVPYPYPEQDACKSLINGECPLKKDAEVTYNLEMPISKKYPTVTINIEFSLVDENKNVQVCFNMDVKVTNK